MNILLTGSSGFLGTKIFNFYNSIHNVYTLNRKSGDYILDLSITKPNFNHNFDLIIHNAGKAHVTPRTKNESQSFLDTNVAGTINLLDGLSVSKIPKQFVFISSVSVYGLIEGDLIDESAPLLALDPYGKSKIIGEELIKKWCDKNNVICTILRLPLIVGYNPPGNLSAMIKAIKQGYYFNINGGNTSKSMVLGNDVAKFLLKAANIGGTYNLTDGYHPTFNELSLNIALQLNKSSVPNISITFAKLLAIIGDVLGIPFPINSNKLQKIISPLTFDDSKARMSFGWDPTPVLNGFKLKNDVQ